MESKKINLIDLDHTLIPYDSYSNYLKRPLYNFFYFIPCIFLIILRKLRVISLTTQKKYSVILNQNINGYQEYVKDYSDQLINDINNKVMNIITDNSDSVTINILCTASPHDYAVLVATKLGWDCIASQFPRNHKGFIHVYGKNKISIINELYPKNKYDYNFAISDSYGDITLLAQFKKSVLYNNHE